MSQNFKEQFFSCAKLIGSHSSVLFQHLGQCNEIEKDEHRAYVWYKETKTSFCISNNNVDDMSCPKADAYGRQHFENMSYFSIDGIKLGMSKDEVFGTWGKANQEYGFIWYYWNKGGLTLSGHQFSLCVGFTSSNNIPLVSHFEARIE